MKNMKFLPVLGLVAFAVLLPGSSEAYEVTEQTAVAYGESQALYMISFTFEADDHDLYVPIMAYRDSAPHEAALTYSLLVDGDDEATSTGYTSGLVLSEAEVVDEQYYVPEGESATFDLYVILTLPEGAPEAEYALTVTDLPFTTVADDTEEMDELTDEELEGYLTDSISLRGIESDVIEVSIEPTELEVEITDITITPTEADLKIYPSEPSSSFRFGNK